MTRAEIQSILASAGQAPKHQFGQNFMVDQTILAAIADAGNIQPTDLILEVGPGVGNLTRLLAAKAAHVLAVDIDKKLLPAAQRHHAHLQNITWLNADILSTKHQINPEVIAALGAISSSGATGLRSSQTRAEGANLTPNPYPLTPSSFKLISNLPYNAASPIIAELLVHSWTQTHLTPNPYPLTPLLMAFTVQLEVAQRMTAKPDTSDYGPLGILIQLMASVQIIRKIPPGAFWPPPKVHSALVTVTPDPAKISAIPDALFLQRLLSGIFSHRRQKISNALRHHLAEAYTPTLAAQLTAAGIDLTLRPEALKLPQFLTLATLTRPSDTQPATENNSPD